MKKAIPKEWVDIVKTENSPKKVQSIFYGSMQKKAIFTNIRLVFLQRAWGASLKSKCGIENDITLYHLVFEYRISDKTQYDFSYFLAIVEFSIYKAYYISEQNTKRVYVYSLLAREYLQTYGGNEIIQKS